jgi:hypothetical protein
MLNAPAELSFLMLSIHDRGQFHTVSKSSYGSASIQIPNKKHEQNSSGHVQIMAYALERTQVTKLDMNGGRCDENNLVNIQECIRKHIEDNIECTIPAQKPHNGNNPMCDNSNQGQNFTVRAETSVK